MQIETDVSLKPYNTLGLPGTARVMVRIAAPDDVRHVLAHPTYGGLPKRVLGGGSNVVLMGCVPEVVLKVEIMGRRLATENPDAWIVEAGAGESWHDLVCWTLENGWPGLENLALIPGTVGGAPIQNIGAYGVEFKDRFLSLDAINLETGEDMQFAPDQCRFGYRDSIFKGPWAGRCLVTRVRLRLPRPWRPVLDYPDLARRQVENGPARLDARQVCEWVCSLRRAKLPDPEVLGNAGSFFKNPVVSKDQYRALAVCHPAAVGHRLPDGRVKLSAGWLIEACGWKGRSMGRAGVHVHQALVLVNRGDATGGEILTVARAIQASVRDHFGIDLEMEPTLF